VGRNIQQTDGIADEHLGVITADRLAVVLPADAAPPQAGDLVAALPAEQPGQGDRADQFDRVEEPGTVHRQVSSLQVQPRPHKLRPDVVGDHPRVGAEQGTDAARGGQGAFGSEPAGQPLPLLAVAEERSGRCDQAGLRRRLKKFADTVLETDGPLGVVADVHPVQRSDPGSTGLPGPVGRICRIGLFRRQPTARS
jgi:hypothetical protein